MRKAERKQSIALLHYSVPPIIGGVEEVLRQHANLFYRYYHKVLVLAGEGGEFSRKYEISFNPLLSSRNKTIIEAQRLSIEEGNNERIFKLSRKIYNFLERFLSNVEIIIAHNIISMDFNLPFTLALNRLANETEKKIIAWNHDSPYFYENYPSYLNREPWNILKKFNPRITYVAITEARKRWFSKLYGTDRIEVITNGVDPVEFFGFSPITIRLLRELNLFSADLIVLQPFRMVRRKNIELSVRVLKALKEKGIKAKFILTGKYDPHNEDSRNYHKELLNLIKELELRKDFIILTDLRLPGGHRVVPSREMVKEFYQISDLVFIPSKQEGFGLPLLEAGLLKLPIVCSDISPFREIGGSDVMYFSFQESPEEIAEKIIKYMSSFAPGRMFRKIMREYVLDNIYKNKIYPLLSKLA